MSYYHHYTDLNTAVYNWHPLETSQVCASPTIEQLNTPGPLVICENALEEDFATLYQMGVIDHTGRLASHIDQRPCLPTPAVIAVVASFLQTPIGDNPRLQTPLQLLLREKQQAYNLNQPIHSFKIVGSLVPYLLQAMLPTLFTARLAAYKGAAELLCRGEAWHNLTRLPRDYDMRSETPYATLENIHTRLNSVAKRYVPLSTTGAAAAPFTKFIPAFATQRKQCEEPSLPTYEDYILVAINDLDYCAGSTFKRSHLFENSNLQLKIYADSLTPDLSQLRIEITSERGQVLQALFDRAYKRLRIHAPENVDYRGATNWQSTIVAGSIPCNSSDYFTLLDKLITDYQIIAPVPTSQWSQRLMTLLARTAESHNDSTDEARAALTLQFELSNAFHTRADFPPSYQGFIGQNLWKWLATSTSEPLFNLRIQHNLSGQQIATLLHIGAWLKMGLPEGCGTSRYAIAFKSIDGQPAVRYTLNQTYHLLVPLSLHDLKAIMQERSFQRGVENADVLAFLTGCYTHQQDVAVMTAPVLERYRECFGHLAAQPTLAYAEECLEHANPFFQLVGTALLIAQAALGNTTAEQLLLCKALPQLLQAQAPLPQWGRDIATAWLYYRAANQQQQASIQAALIQLQEDAVAAPLAWWQALLATGYPLYQPWVIQNTLALGNCASLTADQQQLAWYTAYRTLRLSGDESAINAALPQLLHQSETSGWPIDVDALLWLSMAICTCHKTAASRLLPLWSCSLQNLPSRTLDIIKTHIIFTCCQYRMEDTQLPVLMKLAPLAELCSLFAEQGIQASSLYPLVLQQVLLPAIDALLACKSDPAILPLCEKIASCIDIDAVEGEAYAVCSHLISYLAENSVDVHTRAIYTLRLCQEQMANGAHLAAIATLLSLTHGPVALENSAAIVATAQALFEVLINSRTQKNKSWQLLSVPLLTHPLLTVLQKYRDIKILAPLCQKLITHGEFTIAGAVVLLFDRQSLSRMSRSATKLLLQQLSRQEPSHVAANAAMIALLNHLTLDDATQSIDKNDYGDALKTLQTVSKRLTPFQHLVTPQQKLLRKHLRQCVCLLLNHLLSSKAAPAVNLAISQGILCERRCPILLGTSTWAVYIHRWIKRTSSSDIFAAEEMLSVLLSSQARKSLSTATRCYQDLIALCKQPLPAPLTAEHACKRLILLQRLLLQQPTLACDFAIDLLAVNPLVHAIDNMQVVWEWLSTLQPYLTTEEQCKIWLHYAHLTIKGALDRNDDYLAATIIAHPSCDTLPEDLSKQYKTLLPRLLKIALETQVDGALWALLLKNLAASLDDKGWSELWLVLTQHASLAQVEQAHGLWKQHANNQNVVELSYNRLANCYRLCALAAVHSELCLDDLREHAFTLAILSQPHADLHKRTTACLNLIDMAITHSTQLPKDTAETIYLCMHQLASSTKKQPTLEQACFKNSLKKQNWSLATLILTTHLKVPQHIPVSTTKALFELSIPHLPAWPMHTEEAATLALLNIMTHLKPVSLTTRVNTAQTVYRWLLALPDTLLQATLPITQQPVYRMRDGLVLSLLSALITTAPYVVRELLPATMTSIESMAQEALLYPQLPDLLNSSDLLILVDSSLLPRLRCAYIQATLILALEADHCEARTKALSLFIKYYDIFPFSLATQTCAHYSIQVLMALLTRDSQELTFEGYQGALLICSGHRQMYYYEQPMPTAGVTEAVAALENYDYYYRVLDAMTQVVCHNQAQQNVHIQCMHHTLRTMLKCYMKQETQLLTSQDIFRCVKNFCFHAYAVDPQQSDDYDIYMREIYELLAQSPSFERSTELASLRLYLYKGINKPPYLNDRQFCGVILTTIETILPAYPHLYPIALEIISHTFKKLNAFENNYKIQGSCYLYLMRHLTSGVEDQPRKIAERYTEIAKLLAFPNRVYGAHTVSLEHTNIRAMHCTFFKQLCHVYICDLKNTVAPSETIQHNYFGNAFIYLQMIIRADLLNKETDISIESLWQVYCQFITPLFNLFLASVDQCTTLHQGQANRLDTLTQQLSRLHLLITQTDFIKNAPSLEKLRHLQKQLHTEWIEQLTLNAKRSVYIDFLPCPVQAEHLLISPKELSTAVDRGEEIYQRLSQATTHKNQAAVELALTDLEQHPAYITLEKMTTCVANALIYLYIECRAKACMTKHLTQLVDLCPPAQTPAENAIALASLPSITQLVQQCREYNPRLALYLLIIDQLLQASSHSTKQCDDALKLARGLVKQLGEKYEQHGQKLLPDLLAKLFCNVLMTPRAYSSKTAAIHLASLQSKDFEVLQRLLPTYPLLHARYLFFTRTASAEALATISLEDKQEAFEDLITTLLHTPLWHSFCHASILMKTYQTQLYTILEPKLLTLYERLVDTYAHLVASKVPDVHFHGFQAVVELIHNNCVQANMDIVVVNQNSILSHQPRMHALLLRINELLTTYLAMQPSSSWKDQSALLYVLDIAAVTICTACDKGIYNKEKALYFTHLHRLLPLSHIYLRLTEQQQTFSDHIARFSTFFSVAISDLPPLQQMRMELLSAWFAGIYTIRTELALMTLHLLKYTESIVECYAHFNDQYLQLKRQIYRSLPPALKKIERP